MRTDWVFVYFDGKLGLAKISSDMRSSAGHPLNRGGELFKFPQSEPEEDVLAQQPAGRLSAAACCWSRKCVSTTRQWRACQVAGRCRERKTGVTRRLESKSLDEFLELLGQTSWESVCEAYLSMEHHFVRTGLSSGGTLQDFDVVGRRSTDGVRILAQCKKNPEAVPIDDGFIDAIGKPSASRIAFYFAFRRLQWKSSLAHPDGRPEDHSPLVKNAGRDKIFRVATRRMRQAARLSLGGPSAIEVSGTGPLTPSRNTARFKG